MLNFILWQFIFLLAFWHNLILITSFLYFIFHVFFILLFCVICARYFNFWSTMYACTSNDYFLCLFSQFTLLYQFMCLFRPITKNFKNFLSKGLANLCVLSSKKAWNWKFSISRPKNIVGPFFSIKNLRIKNIDHCQINIFIRKKQVS